MSVQRYFIYLAYDGTHYHGWQIQPNGISIQECLMKALAKRALVINGML
jgi:tRNA pseudouridine38-40 synthase